MSILGRLYARFRGRRDPRLLLARFLGRYVNRTIIVHRGIARDWLEELLKQPGGAGHFRFDARRGPGRTPSPIEWLVHAHVLPLDLPLPLIIQVREDRLRVRHLRRGTRLLHPSEIMWLLDEIDARHHAVLLPVEHGLEAQRGIPSEDNAIETPYGVTL